ncbi:J domain-containing protein [Oleidesulfovibrio alaskensis]|uniref:J domain-containing protein n=1 Tax=Oleidesulfovibrio alaskensis TaxID=58180 RepID=UPI001A4BD494|nr:DnaJ domain-containing protein [Oleidesulfovibrio alaskensis]MBL3583647.1 DnaJ domain-containing protein [Oleidesulfovibrio alaskensis]
MTLQECYRILQIPEGSDNEAVKAAYRRRAFELHPDLHPDKPDAGRQFRRLNEAYVILTRRGTAAGNGGTTSGAAPSGGAAAGRQARDDAFRAYSRAKQNFRSGTGKQKEQTTRKTAAGQDTASGSFYYRQEDVLQDILKDPFARRVFEDIYAQVRREGSALSRKKPQKRRKLALEWGESKLNLDLSQGLVAGIRGWMRGQMDDEQTVYLPPANLVPGSKVRLNISVGFTGEKKTLEVTLPPDFVVGRPIRLRGQGRKIGAWRGDLYIRILVKTGPQ